MIRFTWNRYCISWNVIFFSNPVNITFIQIWPTEIVLDPANIIRRKKFLYQRISMKIFATKVEQYKNKTEQK